jgi:pyrimidine operon attenuation protein / uracil phosphoribosyltransferase
MPRARIPHNIANPSPTDRSQSLNKHLILNAAEMRHLIARIAQEILKHIYDSGNIVLVGMYVEGIPLAERLAACIHTFESVEVPVGRLNFTAHRDDVDSNEPFSTQEPTVLPVDITGRTVVLVDDVIHTGRSIRAALDTLFVHGRPARVQAAVLIDRGHRELPIRADYVGKNVPTARDEWVQVCLSELSEQDGVYLIRKGVTA